MNITPQIVMNETKIADRFDNDFASISGEDMMNLLAVQKDKGFIHLKNGKKCSESLSGDFADLMYHNDAYYLYDAKEKAIFKKPNDASLPAKWLDHVGPNTIFSKSMRVGHSKDHLLINEKAKRVRFVDIENPKKNFLIKFKSKLKSKMLCHQSLPENRVAMMYYNGILEVHSYNAQKSSAKFESTMSAIANLDQSTIGMLEYAYSFALNQQCNLLAVSVGRGGYMSRVSVFASEDNWSTNELKASLEIDDQAKWYCYAFEYWGKPLLFLRSNPLRKRKNPRSLVRHGVRRRLRDKQLCLRL